MVTWLCAGWMSRKLADLIWSDLFYFEAGVADADLLSSYMICRKP